VEVKPALLAALVVSACSPREAKPPRELTLQTTSQHGYSLRVPEGARVNAGKDRLEVDAPLGDHWFDIRWIDTPVIEMQAAEAWGLERCLPLRWDIPVEPVPNTWTAGGTCTIGDNRYWVLLTLEEHGERTLLTGITGAMGKISYESLWVSYLTTALSLSGGSTPVLSDDPAVLRQMARTMKPRTRGESLLPVPGGGTLSGDLFLLYTPVFQARTERSWPSTFDGSAPPASAPAAIDEGADPTPPANDEGAAPPAGDATP